MSNMTLHNLSKNPITDFHLFIQKGGYLLILLFITILLFGCGGGDTTLLGSTNTPMVGLEPDSNVDIPTGSDSNDNGTVVASLEMVTPSDQAVGVSQATSIVINTNIDLNETSVNSNNVQLIGPGGNPITINILYNNRVITIDPINPLQNSTAYAVTISRNLTDMNGNSLPSDFNWSFTTTFGDLPPEFAAWESNMVTWGKHWGEFQNPDGGVRWAVRFDNAYYDMLWNLYQIKEYSGQNSVWDQYIEYAKSSYRDEFYRPDNYHSNGYYRFPHGLLTDYLAGGDTTIQDIRMIRDNMAFSLVVEYDENGDYPGQSQRMSREMSYALQANVCAEKAGEPRMTDRISHFIPWMENHLYEWKSGNFSDSAFFQPFMFGLTAHALIEFYEWEVENGRDPHAYWPKTHWNTIPEALADFAEWMYNTSVVRAGPYAGQRMWVANYGGQGNGAFRYADREYEEGAGTIYPGLNLLITPVYAWVYKQTGDTTYREIADIIFAAGVRQFNGDWSGKAFNQNYRWSFKYVDWRREGDQLWLQ